MNYTKVQKGVILFIFFIFVCTTVQAEVLLNETQLFSGASQNYTIPGTSGAEGSIGGNGGGYITNISVKFNLVKLINEVRVPAYIYSGSYVQLTLNASAAGKVQKTTDMIAYVDGVEYGTGRIGWFRENWDVSDDNYNYWIIFDYIDETYASTLNSEKELTFVYDHTVFSDYIPADLAAVVYYGKGTGANNPLVTMEIAAKLSGGDGSYRKIGMVGAAGYQTYTDFYWSDYISYNFYNFSGVIVGGNIWLYSAQYNIYIQNITGIVYYSNTTTYTVNESFVKTTGLYIYIQHSSSGSWVNRTVYSGLPDVPIIYHPNGTSPSGQITFYGTLNYSGLFGVYSNITTENYSSWDTYYLDVRKPDGELLIGFPKEFSTQNYDAGRFWYFSDYGTWKANLSYCSWYDLFCDAGDNLIDIASVAINKSVINYKLYTDKDSYVRDEIVMINVTNPSNNILTVKVKDNADFTHYTYTVPASQTNYTINHNTSAMMLGTYVVYLLAPTEVAFVPEVVASKQITVKLPTAGDNVLGIGWTVATEGGTVGVFGETGILQYITAYDSGYISLYKPVNNVTVLSDNFSVSGNISSSKQYKFDVVGTWNARIKNSTTEKWANITVIPTAEVPPEDDYSLPNYIYWSNDTYTQGMDYVINWKVTGESGFDTEWTANITNPNGKIVWTDVVAYTYGGETATGAITGVFGTGATIGKWLVVLEKTESVSGTPQRYVFVTLVGKDICYVTEVVAEPYVQPGDEAAQSAIDVLDTWVSLMGLGLSSVSRFLFAIIVICITCLGGFLVAGGKEGGAVIMGFVPYGFFTYIGYIPIWFMIIVIMIIGMKIGWFR